MIVFGNVLDKVVDGQRRAKGKKMRHRVVLGIDNYNVVLLKSSGNNPLASQSFGPSLQFFVKRLPAKTDETVVATNIAKALSQYMPDVDISKVKTLADCDRLFSIPQRAKNSSGCLAFYSQLKSAIKGAVVTDEEDDDSEDGSSNGPLDITVDS